MTFDIAIIVLALLFFIMGLVRGAASVITSFLAMVLGLIWSWHFGFYLVDHFHLQDFPRTALLLLVLVIGVSITEVVLQKIEELLENGFSVVVRPLPRFLRTLGRALNALAGGVLGALLMVLVVWLMMLPVRNLPWSEFAGAVNKSQVLTEVDRRMPQAWQTSARTRLDELTRELLPSLKEFEQKLKRTKGAQKTTTTLHASTPEEVDQKLSVPVAISLVERSHEQIAPKMLLINATSAKCAEGAQGSGVAIAPHEAVTAAHVVAGMNRIEVLNEAGDVARAEVIGFDPVNDLAILRVRDLTLEPIELGKSAPAATEPVVMHGFPGDQGYRVHGLRVEWERQVLAPGIYGEKNYTRRLISLRGDVERGESGGAVVNAQGQLVGITVMGAEDGSKTAYATSIDPVKWLKESAEKAEKPVSTQACLQRR